MKLIMAIRNVVIRGVVVVSGLTLLAGCAGTLTPSHMPQDYVEVQNPAVTMSPNAPMTIWVPKKSVDNGVPRGTELVKQGYEKFRGGATPATTPTPTAAQTGLVDTTGKTAALLPHFGLVVAVDGEKIYFNLGKESGLTPFQKLKVYRGGTVVEGLGLAPGEAVATIEVQGFVGTNGAYGLVTQGGRLRVNDLVGLE